MLRPNPEETKSDFLVRFVNAGYSESLGEEVWTLHEEYKELKAKQRNELPAGAFVFPKERRYPIHDRAHGANALARASGTADWDKVRAAV